MFRNKAAAILIAGMILFAGTTVMAQSVGERTAVSGMSPHSRVVSATEFALDREWMQEPTLYCMNLDRGRPQITRKRLALDPSIQELRWVAAHGPRRDMLESFLSRQAGNDEVTEGGQMVRVGGTIDSWSDIKASEQRTDYSLVSIGRLDVGLIGPERVER